MTALLGEKATKTALEASLAEGCSVLHLAAHGLLDMIAPAMSAIVLANEDRLTMADLAGLNIESDLAILSACDSGRGAATMSAN